MQHISLYFRSINQMTLAHINSENSYPAVTEIFSLQ